MKLSDTIFHIVANASHSITPQDVRDRIKQEFPALCGTDAAKRSVDAGHYKDIDHVLLASIYTAVRNDDRYLIDRSTKPYRVSVESSEAVEEALETPEGEDPEQVMGLVYVLGTGVFTKDGKRIVKIGYTTQDIATRIRQLYTTGAMFQFEELASYRVDNYDLLEQALHKLLAPFRLNNAREFFSEDALPFVNEIAGIHQRIQAAPGAWTRA
ncbi:GIY-YIG nuclease family protein [Burkholderia glumae]|uniref:GIY-YIG nuclease family protein n=1 Tax=Burkholderia glumae TaxID=337 RepID=UPI0021519938|nr:GIY-YIG nuclease family protein [Burkholderia glumae]